MDDILKGPDPGCEAELDNFIYRVDEISKIIEGLASADSKDQENAIRKADILLHDKGGGEADADLTGKVTYDRTLINKAPDLSVASPAGDGGQVSFMRMVEKDAAERAQDRINQKKKSDEFRAKGNDAFKRCAYAEALHNYNKAIDLIKDSPCLYTNRALTWIRVGIPLKALEDLNLALDLNPNSLKARLLKARALFNMGDPMLCREWLTKTKKLFPDNLPMINRYEEDLFELRMELNKAFNEHENEKKRKTRTTGFGTNEVPDMEEMKNRLHEITRPEATWLKAARGQIGEYED